VLILTSQSKSSRFPSSVSTLQIIFYGMLVLFLGPSIAGVREESFRGEWYIQWLCLTGCLAPLPLLIFPRFFRRLGRLDEGKAT
jgi:hypothetical protein